MADYRHESPSHFDYRRESSLPWLSIDMKPHVIADYKHVTSRLWLTTDMNPPSQVLMVD